MWGCWGCAAGGSLILPLLHVAQHVSFRAIVTIMLCIIFEQNGPYEFTCSRSDTQTAPNVGSRVGIRNTGVDAGRRQSRDHVSGVVTAIRSDRLYSFRLLRAGRIHKFLQPTVIVADLSTLRCNQTTVILDGLKAVALLYIVF